MIVKSFLSPADLTEESVKNTWVVVIDVLRATSTIVTALHNGAKLVRPVADTAEAIRIAGQKRGEEILLAGEENGFKINGFDLGNSPLEYAHSVIYGKKIILKTTNGTRAFLNVQSAPKILVGSFLNAQAAAGFLNRNLPER
ncbi:MAG TPA: 2-phosphosulfolactate phosphatase, partial [Bacteroidetes bacterium]|nr:2-phosphosulfolactate phosphatase [Bacteroidota bacterium]